MEFVEIEDTREIRKANLLLGQKLRRALWKTENRTIGSPGGSFKGLVHFAASTASEVLYWSKNKNGGISLNLFGHGAPTAKTTLNIDVQFNVPTVSFSRRSGGAFLRHVPTGRVFLAHRGIATLGHGRIPKTVLFHNMASFQKKATTSKGVRRFLLISGLESRQLITEIDAFSSAFRDAAKAAKAVKSQSSISRAKRKRVSSSRSLSGKLGQYFAEFSGEVQLKSRKATVTDRYHGRVVEAIRRCFGASNHALKNQAIDLTVIAQARVILFEVKTSSRSQSIYTAIGQLTAHAQAVADKAPQKKLVKVMVLPERPSLSFCDLIEEQLGISLLTFSRYPNGFITIDGIETVRH